MPFKPSSLRLRGWDGEHPALFGFSENSLSYGLAVAQGLVFGMLVEQVRSRSSSRMEQDRGDGCLDQNGAPAVRIDELGAVAYCQTRCRLATHLQITSVCRVTPDQAQLGSLGGLRL